MPYHYRVGEIKKVFFLVLVYAYQAARKYAVHYICIGIVVECRIGVFFNLGISVFGNKGSRVYPRERVHNRIFISGKARLGTLGGRIPCREKQRHDKQEQHYFLHDINDLAL